MGGQAGVARWLEVRDQYEEAQREGRLATYRKRRWQRGSEFVCWLEQEELLSLSIEQATALYRACGGNRTGEFKSNPIEEIRDSLDFLLYDTIKLEGRFDECAAEGGGFKLAGAGKEFVSFILCLRDPSLFAVWSSHAERALRVLGTYPDSLRRGLIGMRYMDLLDALYRVRGQLGLPDFRVVDEFCYFVARSPRS